MRNDYILDANVLMSLLIGGKASTFNFLRLYNYYAPDFIFNEIDEHGPVIRTKTRFSEVELKRYATRIFRRIAVLPRFIISEQELRKAEQLCADVDKKDVAYVALSISTSFPLITRDKPLHTGLRKKGFRNVMLFDEFLASL